mmetsp:Transcript_1536/g.4641  ORF Transcript_1536/g.4641 Transcript_1536/m.4641 type:complete len:296 (+) Transcript_1536:538-1425(+)
MAQPLVSGILASDYGGHGQRRDPSIPLALEPPHKALDLAAVVDEEAAALNAEPVGLQLVLVKHRRHAGEDWRERVPIQPLAQLRGPALRTMQQPEDPQEQVPPHAQGDGRACGVHLLVRDGQPEEDEVGALHHARHPAGGQHAKQHRPLQREEERQQRAPQLPRLRPDMDKEAHEAEDQEHHLAAGRPHARAAAPPEVHGPAAAVEGALLDQALRVGRVALVPPGVHHGLQRPVPELVPLGHPRAGHREGRREERVLRLQRQEAALGIELSPCRFGIGFPARVLLAESREMPIGK